MNKMIVKHKKQPKYDYYYVYDGRFNGGRVCTAPVKAAAHIFMNTPNAVDAGTIISYFFRLAFTAVFMLMNIPTLVLTAIYLYGRRKNKNENEIK